MDGYHLQVTEKDGHLDGQQKTRTTEERGPLDSRSKRLQNLSENRTTVRGTSVPTGSDPVSMVGPRERTFPTPDGSRTGPKVGGRTRMGYTPSTRSHRGHVTHGLREDT